MNWYSVTIKDKGAKPLTGSSYIQAEDEEKAKETAKDYMPDNLGLQGIRRVTVNSKIEEGEKKVKNLVIGGGFNGMIYNDGTYVSKGNLKSGF